MDVGLNIHSIMILAVGLAMDAFSVATVAGSGLNKLTFWQASKMSFSFGAFHVFMPMLGWLAGSSIVWLISKYDHWVAFLLLAFVGGRMIYEAFRAEARVETFRTHDNLNLLFLSVAVSIDAVAIGLSFYLENIQILLPAVIIGIVTSVFTFVGMVLGNKTGRFIGKGAQVLGGIILIAIGLRIVITHIFQLY